jgi:hypothetical protein
MDLALLGCQHVFSHRLTLLPTVRLLTYPRRREMARRGGLNSPKIVSEAFFVTVSIFPDTTDYYRIQYQQ